MPVPFGSRVNQHFLLKCPIYEQDRLHLLRNIEQIANNLNELNDKNMVHLFLYGDPKLSSDENKTLLKSTITFIDKTGRFSPEENNL